MAEELDYMSDAFLEQCAGTKEDVRPGLPKTHSQKREHNLLKRKRETDEKNKQQNRPQSSIQSERLEEGLQKPISSTNKGYSMLEKMGFKPGAGLGKTSSGIVEPIAINVKNDRQGLGRAEALRQIKIHKRNIRKRHEGKTISVEDYRVLLSKKSKEREVASDLRKSQRICHQLDLGMNVKLPAEEWFWPEDCLPQKEEKITEDEDEDDNDNEEEEEEEEMKDDNSIEYEPSEKLEMLTSYLRQTFCYCIWCGVQYDDEKDLQDCPGPTRDLH